jgi:hypothetical protein
MSNTEKKADDFGIELLDSSAAYGGNILDTNPNNVAPGGRFVLQNGDIVNSNGDKIGEAKRLTFDETQARMRAQAEADVKAAREKSLIDLGLTTPMPAPVPMLAAPTTISEPDEMEPELPPVSKPAPVPAGGAK